MPEFPVPENLRGDPRLKAIDPTAVPIESLPEKLPLDPEVFPPGVSQAPELAAAPLELKVSEPVRPRLRQDLCWLALGPLYELVRLEHDLMRQFRQDTKYDGPLVDLQLQRPVLGGLQHWGNILQGIDPGKEEQFIFWILNQLFVRRPRPGLVVWWRPRRQKIQVHDPLRVEAGGILGPEDLVTLHVFLPFGSRGMAVLDAHPVCPRVTFNPDLMPPVDTIPHGL